MTVAKVATVFIITAAAVLSGCDEWAGSNHEAQISVNMLPGLAVPDIDQLAKRLESSLRYPQPGTRDWMVVKPVPGRGFSAVVRAFDAKQGIAYVELTYHEFGMPLVQFWRFDGKAWHESVDPGIVVR